MIDPADTSINVERRSGRDRRKRAVVPINLSGHRRRRSKGRRRTDPAAYVDVYGFGSWGVAVSVLILSLTDAVLTGLQIHGGSVREANPIMDAVIHLGGIYSFLSLKTAMTALPLAILVVHKEWMLARYAARLCLLSYILVVLYHVYLLIEYDSLAGFVFHLS